MKMPLAMYDELKRDFFSVVATARTKNPGAFGPLTIGQCWRVLSRVDQERQYTGDLRAQLESLTGFPCSVAAIPDYRMGPWYAAGLNDSHVETAFRKILAS